VQKKKKRGKKKPPGKKKKKRTKRGRMKEKMRKGFVGEAAHGKKMNLGQYEFLGAEVLADPKKKMWGSLKLISDSPQYEVHLAMLSQQGAVGGDLAKCRKHGNVDLRT